MELPPHLGEVSVLRVDSDGLGDVLYCSLVLTDVGVGCAPVVVGAGVLRI